MPTEMSEEEIYEEAKKRIKARQGFYRHLGAYLTVNAVLIVVWALSGGVANTYTAFGFQIGNMWFLWPLGIWGIFVLWNFIEVFLLHGRTSEKAAIEKEVKKIKKEE